jgi:CHAT domain-containing protein
MRASETPAAAAAALVLADPDVPRASPDGELALAPLPWARREARAIARTLGLDSRHVLEGSAATEHVLKAGSLGGFAVLHLAAHARADEAYPDRSAVFLAAGHATEDGWLQPREISRLDLRGRLVVLSACESADGRVLSGEGPLSLARAFFAAGASGVIATRWPLRDDDAAFMMERFYRALGSGADAGAALRRTRHDAIDAGLPAAAWAGVALLGDGLRAPVRATTHPDRSPLAVVLLVLVGAAIGWQVVRRTRQR